MAQPDYIFIGGCYRTGTDLFRNALNSSAEIAICGETHYMGDLPLTNLVWEGLRDLTRNGAAVSPNRKRWELAAPGSRQRLAQVGDLTTEAGARRIVDYLYDHVYKMSQAFWHWLPDHVDRETFLAKVLATDRTERSFFELMMALYAGNRPVRGEKTPIHIHYLPTLLEWFPNAKFVHMLRDPRAIFLSQRKKKSTAERVAATHRLFRGTRLTYEVYLGLGVAIHWLRVVQLHDQYQRLYPDRYCLVLFEDVIADPATHLGRACAFLGVDFTERMLQRRIVNSSFASAEKDQTGFNKSAIDRWRQQLHPMTQKWFATICRKRLMEFGYPL
jgi:hypothetical protein